MVHTATPFIYSAPDPQRDIVEPAIKGTVDAIKAAIDNGVKRVVICSSGGAAYSIPVPSGTVVTDKVILVPIILMRKTRLDFACLTIPADLERDVQFNQQPVLLFKEAIRTSCMEAMGRE